MMRANTSVAPGPRVGAISPPRRASGAHLQCDGAGRGRSGSQATRGDWFSAGARRGETGLGASVSRGAANP
jgi:hypothetical protein